MKDLFKFNVNPKSNKDFVRPNVNSVYKGEWSMRWFGPSVWDDMLPDSYKKIESLESFKEAIKKWIPENCPCKSCKEYMAGVGYVTFFE